MNSTAVLTPMQFFEQLTERRFATYAAFERAFVALFNRRTFEFPTCYGWRDALRWGVEHHVVAREGDTIVVRVR